jgi:hypothetical protein
MAQVIEKFQGTFSLCHPAELPVALAKLPSVGQEVVPLRPAGVVHYYNRFQGFSHVPQKFFPLSSGFRCRPFESSQAVASPPNAPALRSPFPPAMDLSTRSPALPIRLPFRYRFVTFSHPFPESFPVNSCPNASKVGIIIPAKPKRLDKSGARVYTEPSFSSVTKVTSRLFKPGGRPILPRRGPRGAPPPLRVRQEDRAFQKPCREITFIRRVFS